MHLFRTNHSSLPETRLAQNNQVCETSVRNKLKNTGVLSGMFAPLRWCERQCGSTRTATHHLPATHHLQRPQPDQESQHLSSSTSRRGTARRRRRCHYHAKMWKTSLKANRHSRNQSQSRDQSQSRNQSKSQSRSRRYCHSYIHSRSQSQSQS